ncbi:uncharacterized protein V6R79_007964 [Siganus canaliculatus]
MGRFCNQVLSTLSGSEIKSPYGVQTAVVAVADDSAGTETDETDESGKRLGGEHNEQLHFVLCSVVLQHPCSCSTLNSHFTDRRAVKMYDFWGASLFTVTLIIRHQSVSAAERSELVYRFTCRAREDVMPQASSSYEINVVLGKYVLFIIYGELPIKKCNSIVTEVFFHLLLHLLPLTEQNKTKLQVKGWKRSQVSCSHFLTKFCIPDYVVSSAAMTSSCVSFVALWAVNKLLFCTLGECSSVRFWVQSLFIM